jgi:type I restriction enzyme S subunit
MEDLGSESKFVTPHKTRPLAAAAGSYTYFADGDVLLPKISPCFENGKLGIAAELRNGVGFGSSEYIVFRPSDAVSSEWLYYFLSRSELRDEGTRLTYGTVGQRRVHR